MLNEENPPETMVSNEKPRTSRNTSASASSSATYDVPGRSRLEFLLKQTEIYTHFMTTGTRASTACGSSEENQRDSKNYKSYMGRSVNDRRHRKTEREEDNELLADYNDTEFPTLSRFEKTPSYIKSGQMRDYQISGLNWMISLHENNINGVLADEMGLGKTLQAISVLGYMKHFKQDEGPHLVIVPKSTLQNWLNEFKKWCPSLKVVSFIGDKIERREIIKSILADKEWNVLVTSYEMCNIERFLCCKFNWHYMILDEAHRIKNEKNLLAQNLRTFTVKNRLILTGTPLQNNLHELWSLLNFLLPDIFNSSEDFDQWFDSNNCLGDNTLVTRLHTILKPFMLRRIKSEVEKSLLPKKEVKIFIGMSKLQRDWYTKILMKDIDIINGCTGTKLKMRLDNIVMHLRKCTNHPYLFDGVEEGPPYTTDFHLIHNSGKMIVLDKLLAKLKAQGSRVLIFCQMTRMLDILEDYCGWRNYEYHRLTGSTKHTDRSAAIDEFNSENSSTFIFMLSTRAGGLGINLASADCVIIYDSDWNPQLDLQAMDRAHRIGQKKQVRVFRLVTENSIEEKIVERAEVKLRLDKIVIQQGKLSDKLPTNLMQKELLSVIRFGAQHVLSKKEADTNLDQDIDQLLAYGVEKTLKHRQNFDEITTDEALRNFTLNSTGTLYLSEVPNIPKAHKQPQLPDYQFYPKRLFELMDIKNINRQNVLKCETPLNPELDVQPDNIENYPPLSVEESREKEKLLAEGFANWSNVDYIQFVHLNEKYGRNDLENISRNVEGKTPDQVVAYHNVFWQRYTDLQDYGSVIAQIERGEAKQQSRGALEAKISSYQSPFQELKLNYGSVKSIRYTEDQDRFLLCTLHQLGLDKVNLYNELLNAVRVAPQFPYIRFRKFPTADALHSRCKFLMKLVEREYKEKIQMDELRKAELTKVSCSANAAVVIDRAGVLTTVGQPTAPQKRKFDAVTPGPNNGDDAIEAKKKM